MKEIRLTQVNKKSKSYHVYLGNGTDNAFTSKRDANYFLASTNNFLTDKLHETHQLYVDVWNSMQENWFYFDHNRKTRKQPLFTAERECNSLLEITQNHLNLCVQRCWFTNGNYMVFIHLQKCLDNLEETIRTLADMYGKHSNTNAIYKMDLYVKRILIARNELTNYGRRSTTKLFKVPTHISEDKSYIPDYELSIVA